MNTQELNKTVQALLDGDRGLLAMDESLGTCHKRFAPLGIPQTEEYRRAWRELIVTTPGFGDSISGAILFDETIRQKTKSGRPFVDVLHEAHIVPGIKVDQGAKDMAAFPGEKVTEGLDKLRERLAEYYKLGARFAKWRAVIAIASGGVPTDGCIAANVHALARYAALCQEASIVPIVEPEVLMEGNHTMAHCAEATERTQKALFHELYKQRVDLRFTLLKPNMVLPGIDCPQQDSVESVADATVTTLLKTVPPIVPGVAFLSGGQSAELATARLNAMHVRFRSRLPWGLTFSYSRAIQQPALEAWAGKEENVAAAQRLLAQRARLNAAARRGEYKPGMERE